MNQRTTPAIASRAHQDTRLTDALRQDADALAAIATAALPSLALAQASTIDETELPAITVTSTRTERAGRRAEHRHREKNARDVEKSGVRDIRGKSHRRSGNASSAL